MGHKESNQTNQQCGMGDQQRLRSACAYAQSEQSLCSLLEYFKTDKLLTKQRLEFLTLKGGCTARSSEPTFFKCHTVGNRMTQLIYGTPCVLDTVYILFIMYRAHVVMYKILSFFGYNLSLCIHCSWACKNVKLLCAQRNLFCGHISLSYAKFILPCVALVHCIHS